jgi:hypothetical protein
VRVHRLVYALCRGCSNDLDLGRLRTRTLSLLVRLTKRAKLP